MTNEKFLRELRPHLDATGLPWRVEQGKKHIKLLIDGRLATVISRSTHGPDSGRIVQNTLSTIQRAARAARGPK